MQKKIIAYFDENTRMLYDAHQVLLLTVPLTASFQKYEEIEEDNGSLILDLAKQGFSSTEIIDMRHAGLI